MRHTSQFEKVNIAVSAGNAVVLRLAVGGHNAIVNMEVKNSGANALTAFAINILQHPNGSSAQYLANADFAGAFNDNLRWVSATAPHTLAPGSSSQFIIDVGAAYEIQVVVASTAGSTIELRGTLNEG